jgi:heme A synthase
MPISTIHHIVGGILLLIYLCAFIIAFLREDFSRKVRMFGDILLFFQYLIGIIMLIIGLRNANLHYVFALLPIILIPFSKKLGYKITTLLFFIIIFLAYLSGIKRGL